MTDDALREAEARCLAAAQAFAAAEPGTALHVGLADELLRQAERVVQLRQIAAAQPRRSAP